MCENFCAVPYAHAAQLGVWAAHKIELLWQSDDTIPHNKNKHWLNVKSMQQVVLKRISCSCKRIDGNDKCRLQWINFPKKPTQIIAVRKEEKSESTEDNKEK